MKSRQLTSNLIAIGAVSTPMAMKSEARTKCRQTDHLMPHCTPWHDYMYTFMYVQGHADHFTASTRHPSDRSPRPNTITHYQHPSNSRLFIFARVENNPFTEIYSQVPGRRSGINAPLYGDFNPSLMLIASFPAAWRTSPLFSRRLSTQPAISWAPT